MASLSCTADLEIFQHQAQIIRRGAQQSPPCKCIQVPNLQSNRASYGVEMRADRRVDCQKVRQMLSGQGYMRVCAY